MILHLPWYFGAILILACVRCIGQVGCQLEGLLRQGKACLEH